MKNLRGHLFILVTGYYFPISFKCKYFLYFLFFFILQNKMLIISMQFDTTIYKAAISFSLSFISRKDKNLPFCIPNIFFRVFKYKLLIHLNFNLFLLKLDKFGQQAKLNNFLRLFTPRQKTNIVPLQVFSVDSLTSQVSSLIYFLGEFSAQNSS